MIMTKRTVKIRNRITNEEREAFLSDDENSIVNRRGEDYDFMKWELIEPLPHFVISVFVLFALAIFLVVFAIVWSTK